MVVSRSAEVNSAENMSKEHEDFNVCKLVLENILAVVSVYTDETEKNTKVPLLSGELWNFTGDHQL